MDRLRPLPVPFHEGLDVPAAVETPRGEHPRARGDLFQLFFGLVAALALVRVLFGGFVAFEAGDVELVVVVRLGEKHVEVAKPLDHQRLPLVRQADAVEREASPGPHQRDERPHGEYLFGEKRRGERGRKGEGRRAREREKGEKGEGVVRTREKEKKKEFDETSRLREGLFKFARRIEKKKQ